MSRTSSGHDGKFIGPSIEEILSCIGDAVISTDVVGKIVLFNPAAETIFGYRAEDILGSDIERLIPARFRGAHKGHIAAFGSAPSDVARAMASEREVVGLRRNGNEFAAEAMLSCRHLDRMTLLTVVIRDISQRKAIDEEREIIVAEMSHRFSNIIAMVNSVIGMTARSVASVDEFRDVLEGRLHAISRNQAALVEPGRAVQFAALVAFELAPFRSETGNAIVLDGVDLTVPAKQAVRISLLVHELTTNAVKYGALSTAEGSLRLAWNTERDGDADYLVLDWIERGGPPVSPPTRRGSGSALIERSFGLSNSTVTYAPEGLTARFRIRL